MRRTDAVQELLAERGRGLRANPERPERVEDPDRVGVLVVPVAVVVTPVRRDRR